MPRLGVAAAVVDGHVVAGDVEVEDGRVVRVAAGSGGRGTAAPGFVDLQVNGFGGVDFLAAGARDFAVAGEALLASGVTAYLPTLITSPIDDLVTALGVVEGLAGENTDKGPRVLGAHVEGPFLARPFAGAHNPELIVPPDREIADRLLGAGPVRFVTLAPEQPGGQELVSHLVAGGVRVSVGHTEAHSEDAHEAFDRGAVAVTHLHNAMRRFRSRDPGPAGAALARPEIAVLVINDGIHLADDTLLGAWRATRGRFVLVTDAIAAAGLGEGAVALGDRTVHVADGAARLDDGTLAGSVLTMDAAVRRLVELGVPLGEAIEAATGTPAGLVGERASLRPGAVADIAVLDEDLGVQRTLRDGVEVHAA
ncbi:N-acetylglucosamine-6-phosphate deacetylase [Egibacter rhizosphaerae]|uniref:N-acetylglucosamine-6-phosphate deacetylase n=1 Tax=Egibacter rhizosphaerae TaxID=1670831 RepID=A0A411YDB7_9ACTN|nr:N-acetylglucosamine-6-phosphate deacetylase [Egibacter rhizosphaerae]QBI19211.1 N-acetylglucosamine-6-phosphate deacetylase [Egibacter rhizosphaerae]